MTMYRREVVLNRPAGKIEYLRRVTDNKLREGFYRVTNSRGEVSFPSDIQTAYVILGLNRPDLRPGERIAASPKSERPRVSRMVW